MKLQHTTSLFAVFLFTTAVAAFGCAVSPPVEPGGDPGTAQVSSTEDELASTAEAALTCVANGSGTGEQGGICNGPHAFPPQQDGLCCSGWARERCFARGEPSEMFCTAAPRARSPEDTTAAPPATTNACIAGGEPTGFAGRLCSRSDNNLPPHPNSVCCSGMAKWVCVVGEDLNEICWPRPRFTGDPEDAAALLECVPNAFGTGEQGGICNRWQLFPVQPDGLCCSGWAREWCFARGEPSEMFCSPPPSLVSPEDTGARTLACTPDGMDLGGGICGGRGAGTIRTTRCCSGIAHWHCPGAGEDISIVCG